MPQVLDLLQKTRLAHAITKSNHLVIAGLQVAHVFGFLLLLSSLLLMTLHLLGLVLGRERSCAVTYAPLRLFWSGLSVAIVSGLLMFLTGTRHYFYNRAFDFKMLLLVAAILVQVLLFQRIAIRQESHPWVARLAALLSLFAWFGVGIAGRAIAFV